MVRSILHDCRGDGLSIIEFVAVESDYLIAIGLLG